MNHDTSRSAIEDGPDIDEDDGRAEPGDRCDRCDGHGCWTVTHEDAWGRDVDRDYDCPACDGTGIAP